MDHTRRSIYIFTRRSLPYPLLETFDMANAQQIHSKRDVTTTPLQALTLVNSDIVFGWSQALAGRVINEAGADENARIDRLYRILFARKPSNDERAALQAFLVDHQKTIAEKAEDGKNHHCAAGRREGEARRSAARLGLRRISFTRS